MASLANVRRTYVGPITKGTGGAHPSIMITTRDLDREHDRIFEDGIDFGDFLRAGGPVMYSHDYSDLPVGKTLSLERIPQRGLRAVFDWLTGDDRAARVKNAYDQGVLNGASIGLLTEEATPNEAGGHNITRCSLVEWSLTPVPCNPYAVRSLNTLDLWQDRAGGRDHFHARLDEHIQLGINRALRHHDPSAVIELDDSEVIEVLCDVPRHAPARSRRGDTIDINRAELDAAVRSATLRALLEGRVGEQAAERAAKWIRWYQGRVD